MLIEIGDPKKIHGCDFLCFKLLMSLRNKSKLKPRFHKRRKHNTTASTDVSNRNDPSENEIHQKHKHKQNHHSGQQEELLHLHACFIQKRDDKRFR